MIARNINGDVCEVPVGVQLCGIGFMSVTLTAEDFDNPRFLEWFQEVVIPRMHYGRPEVEAQDKG